MTWKRILCIAVCLVVLTGVAAAAQADSGYQKIVRLTFGYDGGTYHEVAGDVLYGMAPNLYITSGNLRGVILDSTGKEIRAFYLQDPSIAFADPPRSMGAASPVKGTQSSSSLIVTLPYLATGKTFRLYDRGSGTLLATADLSAPLSSFCTDYPSDPDCLSSASGTAGPAPAPVWMVAATLLVAAVVIISGIATAAILMSPKSRKSPPSRPVVLVVDDNPEISDFMCTLLLHNGYTSLTAADGKECLEKLKKQVPDVILLDVMMAPLDGWTTLERIRADPATKSVPVLMITAKSLTPEDVLQYHVCIDDYIIKPFTNDELVSAVSRIIERKKKIVENLHRVQKAGVPQETFCELQKLAKRVDVDRRLLMHLRQQYVVSSAGTRDGGEFWVTAEELISSALSSEVRLEELRRQITGACEKKGCPVPEWDS